MMTESKGVFLMIWGKKEYGYMARNFTMSIRHQCPELSVYLLTDRQAVKGCGDLTLYDHVQYMSSTPKDPALEKMQVYDKLPFDHTLYLDVDALCVGNLSVLLDQLIASDKPYRCCVHTWYDQTSPEDFPLMVWARKSTIWQHFGFTDEKMPATQSSIQYIRKSAFCRDLFLLMQQNYQNGIPLDQLKYKWGGGQPDELYLNVTLAQLGYDPTLEGAIYFGDDLSKSFGQIKDNYYILSMFGTSANIKKPFVDAYDNTLSQIARSMHYKPIGWKYIAGAKHANVRTKSSRSSQHEGMNRDAFVKRFFKEEKCKDVPIDGSVYLFTSYFDSGDLERQKELTDCMRRNIADPNITRIYNLGLAYDDPKVVNLPYKRPTYQDFINEANRAGGDYSIIANSDIYFDDSIRWIGQVGLVGNMIALCRYDIHPARAKLFAYAHSQDTWIFKGHIAITGCDYVLGVPGCDNKFAYDVTAQGYGVFNPAKDIKTYHLHQSNVRHYSEDDRLPPPYKQIYISSVLDIKDNELAKPTLLIKQPGKVGDLIIVLPIARYYSDRYNVHWLCPDIYHPTLLAAPYVTPVSEAKGHYDKIIDLSFGLDQRSPTHKVWLQRKKQGQSFVSLKYELSGVPIEQLRHLEYNRNESKEQTLLESIHPGKPYKLVHRSSDYGSGIDVHGDCVYFEPVEGYTIFDWRKVIEQADEIHCIDSSLANFVDCLTVGAKLYYYITTKVPMPADRIPLVKDWTVVNQLEYAHS